MTRYDKQSKELDFAYFYKEREHETLIGVGIRTREVPLPPYSYEQMYKTCIIYSPHGSPLLEGQCLELFRWRKGECPKDKGKEFFEMLVERRNKALEKPL